MDNFQDFDVFKGNISLFSYAQSFLGEVISGFTKLQFDFRLMNDEFCVIR